MNDKHISNRMHPAGFPLWVCEKCHEWKGARHFENWFGLTFEWLAYKFRHPLPE